MSDAELLRALWPNERVTQASVKRAVHGARKALGDDGDSQSSIRTVRGRGYRLLLAVAEHPARDVVRDASVSIAPWTRVDRPSLENSASFVGRGAALCMLENSMHAAFAGRGRCCVVIGQAGAGKTRALLELARRAADGGAEAWFGRCADDEGAPACWPWTELLRAGERARGSAALREMMGLRAGIIAQGIPELGVHPSGTVCGPCFSEASARFRFYDAMTVFLRRVADQRPLLLILDDLQRADPATLRLLTFVARHVDTARIMIVCSIRPFARVLNGASDALSDFLQHAQPGCVELSTRSGSESDEGRALHGS